MPKSILIVEDDKMHMKLVTDLLISAGYRTFQSPDGVDTLILARAHHPDLIMMDIRLPEASGLDYTKMLKADADLKDIPVVAMTVYPVRGGNLRIQEAGCSECLTKPFSPPTLYETIKKYVN